MIWLAIYAAVGLGAALGFVTGFVVAEMDEYSDAGKMGVTALLVACLWPLVALLLVIHFCDRP